MDERQLAWVQRNRGPQAPPEILGTVLQRMQGRAPLKVPAWRARVAEVLGEVTDGPFRDHAWIAYLRRGALTLNVDDASLVGALRMQWHRRLLETLREQAPEVGVVDVRFRFAPPENTPPKVGREAAGGPARREMV